MACAWRSSCVRSGWSLARQRRPRGVAVSAAPWEKGAAAAGSGSGSGDGADKAKGRRGRSVLDGEELLWNTDWEFEFERDEKGTLAAVQKQERERKAQQGAGAGLGLSRLNDMNDMSVDLSAQLAAPRKPLIPARPETAIDRATTNRKPGKYDLDGWNYAPTRKEKARWVNEWKKAQQYSDGSVPSYQYKPRDMKDVDAPARTTLSAEQIQERRDSSTQAYESMQGELLLTTAGLSGAGAAASFTLGGVDAGASFLIGAAGSLMYLRLLAKKADSLGAQGGGGPPSILVPIILFMAYNRWNTLFAADYGHDLLGLPILLGFFTYKPTSVIQAFRDLARGDD